VLCGKSFSGSYFLKMFCVLSCNHGIDVVFESNLYIDSDRQCISYSVEIFVIFGTWPS